MYSDIKSGIHIAYQHETLSRKCKYTFQRGIQWCIKYPKTEVIISPDINDSSPGTGSVCYSHSKMCKLWKFKII